MPRLELFPFCYRDERTGKWVRARYVAELHEIKARYAQWEITGPAELREVDLRERYFTPAPARGAVGHRQLGPATRGRGRDSSATRVGCRCCVVALVANRRNRSARDYLGRPFSDQPLCALARHRIDAEAPACCEIVAVHAIRVGQIGCHRVAF